MLPLAGTPERAELEAEAQGVALAMLDRAFFEISVALNQTYMYFRHKFLAERDLLDADDRGEAWNDCVTDARVLVAFVNDIWAAQIRRGYLLASATTG